MKKRQSKAAELATWASIIGMFVCAACGAEGAPTVEQSGSEGVPPPDRAPKVADVSGNSFRIADPGVRTCDNARELATEKTLPTPAMLRAQLEGESAEFVILIKREVSLSDFPLPLASRDDTPASSPPTARALEIADTQVCALNEVRDQGGTYLSSFLLINAFVAELTADAAILLSERADVRIVELSQTDTPPP